MESFHTSPSTRWESGWSSGCCGWELALWATEKGKVNRKLTAEILCLRKKSREKWLLLGNCSVNLAIQNIYVCLLFFWEANQIGLESLSMASGGPLLLCVAQWQIGAQDTAGCFLKNQEWALLLISQSNLICCLTFYVGTIVISLLASAPLKYTGEKDENLIINIKVILMARHLFSSSWSQRASWFDTAFTT